MMVQTKGDDMSNRRPIATTAGIAFWLLVGPALADTYYVAPEGSDETGDGSAGSPWATLRHATDNVPDDGSEILFRDGEYVGAQSIARDFVTHATIRAEHPYRATFVSSAAEHRVLLVWGGSNFTLAGFVFTGVDGPTDPYLIQITLDTSFDIVLEDNVFHDSYSNDIIKLNDSAHHITVRGNLFYNQPAGGDEHMDINTVHDIVVEDNVFMNDFAGSGRPLNNDTHPFVLIKNSGTDFVSTGFDIRRNVFVNWEGASDQPFLLLGEDGKSFHEAEDALVENNLFIGNAPNPMTAAFAIKGARDVTFRANTVTGDLPLGAVSWGYAMRLGREGDNPVNDNIAFYNNIWSDPTSTMEHFSSGSPDNTSGAVLDNNLYYNGGEPIPVDADRVLNVDDDGSAIVEDPLLPADHSDLVLPRWDPDTGEFADGSSSIAEAHRRLVDLFGTPDGSSPAIDAADPSQMPADDILGHTRDDNPDVGAVEHGADGDVDTDADSDSDADADSDSDTDADSDGDSDVDGDAAQSGDDQGGCGCSAVGASSASSRGILELVVTAWG